MPPHKGSRRITARRASSAAASIPLVIVRGLVLRIDEISIVHARRKGDLSASRKGTSIERAARSAQRRDTRLSLTERRPDRDDLALARCADRLREAVYCAIPARGPLVRIEVIMTSG